MVRAKSKIFGEETSDVRWGDIECTDSTEWGSILVKLLKLYHHRYLDLTTILNLWNED